MTGSSRRKAFRPTVESLEERTLLSFSPAVITDYSEITGYLAHEATGDFNGDGKVDIAVLSYLLISNPLMLTVLQGNGDGTFQAQTTISLDPAQDFNSLCMSTGDINGDHADELVLLNGTFEMKIFNGSVNGLTANNSSTTALIVSNGPNTTNPAGQLALGHFLHTDRLDVAILPTFGGDMRLMANQGNGTFTEQRVALEFGDHQRVDFNVGNQGFDEGNQILVEDLNGDGLDDAIFSFGTVGTFPNQQSGVLTIKKTSGPEVFTVSAVAAGNLGQDLQAGDLDGDGLLDLAIKSLDGTGGIQLLHGLTDGSFQAFAASPFVDGNAQTAISSVVFGAFTKGPAIDLAFNPLDGIPDVDQGGNPAYVFGVTAGLGTGAFGTPTFTNRHIQGANESLITQAGKLLAADVDGDGTDDLINIYRNFNFGQQARTSVLINAGGTHTTIAFPDLEEGSPITIVATVAKNVVGAPGDPSGVVTFKEGNTVLGQATVIDGYATSDLLFLSAGSHTIVATYSGDDDFMSSVTAPSQINVIVNPGRTKTVLDFPNLTEGQSMVSATVTKYFPDTPGLPEGLIRFMEGPEEVGHANVVNGQVTTSLDLDAGTHTIFAVYGGNGTFTTSTSKSFTINIVAPPLPDLGLLHFQTEGSGLQFNRTNDRFEYTGVAHVGLDTGTFQPLLDFSGSISIGNGKVACDGTVTAHIGNFSALLFAGAFEFDIGHAETRLFQAPSLDNSLQIGGLGLAYRQLELVEGGINLGGQIHLPTELGGQVLDLAIGAGIHIDANGISSHFGGGRIGFPNIGINFGGLKIGTSDLSVDYDAPHDRLTLQGKVTLPELFGGLIPGLTVDLAGNNFIQVQHGQVDVVGDLTVKRIDIVPGQWYLEDVKLHLNTIDNAFEGSGKLFFPGGFGLIAGIGLVNGQLDKIVLGFDGPHIPIPGLPGATLKSLSGTVEGLTTNHPTFGGDVVFTFLPASFDLPAILGGQHFSVSIASLEVAAQINAGHLTATGKVELLKGLKDSAQNEGSATDVDLDWVKKVIRVGTEVHLFDNIVDFKIKFTGSGAGVSFTANATLNIPRIDVGPLGMHVGPFTIAGARAEFEFSKDGDLSNDYVALFGTTHFPVVGDRRIGVRLYFNGKVDLIGLKDPIGQTFTIPADSDMYVLNAVWENDVGDVPIEVIDPNGIVYTEADFDNTTIGLIDTLSSSTSKSIGLLRPIPGAWTLRIPNEVGLGQVEMHGFYEVPDPTLAITSVTPGANGVTVGYDAGSTEANASVTLYYDTDDTGFDGLKIAGGLNGVGAGQSFYWDTTGVPAGTYYVYGKIDDGINPGVFVYSPVSVTIDNQAPVVTPIDDQTINEGDTLTLTAMAVDPNGDTVIFSLADGAPTGVDINPATGELTWTPTESQSSASQTITVVATDTGTPALSGTQTFHVTVNEANAAPVLRKIFALSAPKGGTFSFTVGADDADVPVQTLQFSLGAGAPDGAAIDPVTGEFTWTPGALQAVGVYPITFVVTDNGSAPLTGMSTINLTVRPNAVPGIPGTLQFNANSYQVNEGGSATITVTRTGGSDGMVAVQFSTANGSATAGADYADTYGTLVFADGETSKTFVVPALHDVTDEGDETVTLSLSGPLGGAALGEQAQTTLTIANVAAVVNANPVFTSNGSYSVAENVTSVGTVAATDADLPPQTVTFNITGGADADKFNVTSAGVLTFKVAPDFEVPTDTGGDNIYNLQVTADDGNGGTTVQNIAVTVTAVNDNVPAFTTLAAFSVAENQTSVTTVAATDADQPTQTVTFTITGGADAGKFDLTTGGVLTFKVAPDFETPTDNGANNVYNLQVTANDGNGGTLTQDIAVTVTDVGDTVAPHLEIGGPAASWTKKQAPVAVAPDITVSGTNLSGGTLTININAIGKKKPLDLLQLPSFSAFGTSSGVTFASGHLMLQIQLNSSATATAIQTFLRGIKFSTKGAGLKAPTRIATVTLANASAQSSQVSQTINVHAK